MGSGQRRARRVAVGWLAVLGIAGLAAPTVDALGEGGESPVDAAPPGCSAARIAVDYDVEHVADMGAQAVTALRLTGVPAECEGVGLRVALLAADGRLVADVPAPGGGPTRSAGLAEPVLASEVAAVSLVIGDLAAG
ncbi:hypothetical protein [Cellulomonas chengniuliangii]|uniref:hypothetical protein n=1 Tax=Cellulomonas chengniuliangii TaxID=2968084 RepID=UPI001D0E0E1A|nr:hypothetical protein [Cellulomonas chengniuliangii]MCC2317790.1 hypothetical protein [Cellulomonas chengniuliangii]